MYNSAMELGWFDVATEVELRDLLGHGALESMTSPAARMSQGLDGSATKPAFFGGKPLRKTTTPLAAKPAKAPAKAHPLTSLAFRTGRMKKEVAAPAENLARPTTPTKRKRAQHSGPDTPPKPKQKKSRKAPVDESALLDSVLPHGDSKSGDYVTSTVTELPEGAQKLKSRRDIRPPFRQETLPNGKKKWVLPEEWLANPPKYSRAPLKYGYAQANSLYPRKPIPDDDSDDWSEIDDGSDESEGSDESDDGSESDGSDDDGPQAVAGPGPSTAANRARRATRG